MSRNLQKYIFPFILVVTALGLILGFVIFPTLANIQENKNLIAKRESNIAALDNKMQALTLADQKKSTLEEIVNKTNGWWPDNKSVSNFIVSLEDLTKSENLSFDNLSMTEQNADKSKTSSTQFSFDTSGNYNQILDITTKFEKLDRFNTMDSISLSTDDQGKITARFIGEIYYGG